MKILIDISHPATVHFFRNLIKSFAQSGHDILITARAKDVTIELLKRYNIRYISFGPPKAGLIKKLIGVFPFTWKLYKIIKLFKPDIILNSTSIYPVLLKPLINIPVLSFHNTDSDPALKFLKYTGNIFITPTNFGQQLGRNHIKVNSYNELSFLHPNQLNTKEYDRMKKRIFGTDTKIILLRFVSWGASDDIGLHGFTVEEKIRLVNILRKYGRILISSEIELPTQLQKYHIEMNNTLNKLEIQFLEYCSSIYIGESGAMAAESAFLGIPAVFYSRKNIGFINDLNERYQLITKVSDFNELLKVATEYLTSNVYKMNSDMKLKILLSECIDMTAFMKWFIENYPFSFRIMKETPQFQYNFK